MSRFTEREVTSTFIMISGDTDDDEGDTTI